ncbi:MAG: hypothetical protein R2860_11290 [Desulfobacterales bacterium]
MKQLFHDERDTLMDRLTFFFEKTAVNYVLGQGMFGHTPVRLKGSGADQVEPFQAAEAFVDVSIYVCDLFEDLIEETLSR